MAAVLRPPRRLVRRRLRWLLWLWHKTRVALSAARCLSTPAPTRPAHTMSRAVVWCSVSVWPSAAPASRTYDERASPTARRRGREARAAVQTRAGDDRVTPIKLLNVYSRRSAFPPSSGQRSVCDRHARGTVDSARTQPHSLACLLPTTSWPCKRYVPAAPSATGRSVVRW
jgi:hypothetical protein